MGGLPRRWIFVCDNNFFIYKYFVLFNKLDLKNPLILPLYVLLLHKAIKPEWGPYFMFSATVQSFIMFWIGLKLIGVKIITEPYKYF